MASLKSEQGQIKTVIKSHTSRTVQKLQNMNCFYWLTLFLPFEIVESEERLEPNEFVRIKRSINFENSNPTINSNVATYMNDKIKDSRLFNIKIRKNKKPRECVYIYFL